MFNLSEFERWTLVILTIMTCGTGAALVYGAVISPADARWSLVMIAACFIGVASLLLSTAAISLAWIESKLATDALVLARKAKREAGAARAASGLICALNSDGAHREAV